MLQVLTSWLLRDVAAFASRCLEQGLDSEDNSPLNGSVVQIMRFHTFRDESDTESPIWAEVSDQTHKVKVRFEATAVTKWESEHDPRFTSLAGASIEFHRYCARPAMRCTSQSSTDLELILEVGGFELLGGIGEPASAQDAAHITQFHQPRTSSISNVGREEARRKATQQRQDLKILHAWMRAEQARLLPPSAASPASTTIVKESDRIPEPPVELRTSSSPPVIESGVPPPAQPQRRKRLESVGSQNGSDQGTKAVLDDSKVTQAAKLPSEPERHRQKRVRLDELGGSAAVRVQGWEESDGEFDGLPDLGTLNDLLEPRTDEDFDLMESQAPPAAQQTRTLAPSLPLSTFSVATPCLARTSPTVSLPSPAMVPQESSAVAPSTRQSSHQPVAEAETTQEARSPLEPTQTAESRMDLDSLSVKDDDEDFELPGPGTGGQTHSSDLFRQFISLREERCREEKEEQQQQDQQDEKASRAPGGITDVSDLAGLGSESAGQDDATVEAQLESCPPSRETETSKSSKRSEGKESQDWALTASDEPVPAQARSSFNTQDAGMELGNQSSGREREVSQADPSTQRSTALPSPPLSSPNNSSKNLTSKDQIVEETEPKEKEEAEEIVTGATRPVPQAAVRRPAAKAIQPVPQRMQQYSLSSPDGSESDSKGSGSETEEEEDSARGKSAVRSSPTEEALARQRKVNPISKSNSNPTSFSGSSSSSSFHSTSRDLGIIGEKEIGEEQRCAAPSKSVAVKSEVEKPNSPLTNPTRALSNLSSNEKASHDDQDSSTSKTNPSHMVASITNKTPLRSSSKEVKSKLTPSSSSSKASTKPQIKSRRNKASQAQIEASIPQSDLDKLFAAQKARRKKKLPLSS